MKIVDTVKWEALCKEFKEDYRNAWEEAFLYTWDDDYEHTVAMAKWKHAYDLYTHLLYTYADMDYNQIDVVLTMWRTRKAG